jgi:hypothetical protein
LLFRDSLFRDAPEGFKSNMEVPRNGLSWLISITRRYGIPFTIETAQSLIGDDGRHGTVHSITDQVQPPPHAGHDDARAFFAPPAIKPSGVFGGNGELNGFIVLLIVALIELMLFGLIPAKHTTFSAPKKLIHAHLMHERAFRNSNDLGLVFMNIYVKELITNVANGVVSRYTENARDLHFFYDGNHVTVFDPQDAKNT